MIAKMKEWAKANFHKYFWYFVAFVAGVLVSGFAQYLAG